MEGEFPEQFKCPICFEIPEKEIYQCQNGHTLCDVCVASLALCPQCRVGLGTSRIRSRPLEELLDMMKFNCSYKIEGCQTKVTRKEIRSHSEHCSFGGKRVPLCKHLGHTCSYIVNTKRIQESINHLKNEHQFPLTTDQSLDIKLKKTRGVDSKTRCLWKPILVNVFNNHYVLVISSFNTNLFFACISIGENTNDKVQAKFRVVPKEDKLPVLEWTTKPIKETESEDLLKTPPFKFSIDSLVDKYLEQELLAIYIDMSDNTSITVSRKRTRLTIGPFLTAESLHSNIRPQPSLPVLQEFRVSFEEIVDALQARFDRMFISRAQCNVCRSTPLTGLRLKCLQCPDFDLCMTCGDKNEHSFHHFSVLFTNEQEAFQEKSLRTNEETYGNWKPFVDSFESNITQNIFGSIITDAKELCCRKCKNQPDYICLQCIGSCPFGLCSFCFADEVYTHDSHHYFAVTQTNTAREFTLFVLRKRNIIPPL